MPALAHNLHGTFIALDPSSPDHPACGVLLQGEPGIGKSHAALALLDRGHALVADDAALFTRRENGEIYGACPASIQDHMEVRGLGIINVRSLFGAPALRTEQRLDLMIQLVAKPDEHIPLAQASAQRLHGQWQSVAFLGRAIPLLILRQQPAASLALLVETAARTLGFRQRRV